jgi:hypothetical protein
MATYTVEAPDGKTITLEGPDGASQADVILQAQQLYKPQSSTPASSGQFGETGGGAALGRPINRGQLNVQTTPRPLESALAALTKESVINPVLGAAQLATGGNVGSQTAQRYAEQAKPYQETNPGSYLVGQVAGAVAPAAGIAKGIGMIPSFAKAAPIAQNVGGAIVQGALMPNETGKTGENFYAQKTQEAPVNALLGTIPSAISAGGKGLASLLRKEAGMATGAGETALSEAYKAGKTGNQTFVENMRGIAPMENVLNQAKGALSNMKQDISKEYKLGMMDVGTDKSILDFKGIDKAISEAKNIASYKGQNINPQAGTALQEIRATVDEWKNLPSKEFHTPEGMDALKQKVGAILETIPYESGKARTIAQNIYHSIKNEIADQAPKYNEVMKGYSEGQDLIKEISKSLSLGDKASTATGLNKLQSLMRNNVNTNYGYRQELANTLMQKGGGGDIMPALAGQALSAKTPRGLVGQGLDVSALLGTALTGGAHIPATLATMATTSPRLMGETAYKAGQIASKTPKMTDEQKRLAQLLMIRGAQGATNE